MRTTGVCLLLIAATAAAQTTTVEVRTVGPFGNYARQGNQVALKSIPPNTLVGRNGPDTFATVQSTMAGTLFDLLQRGGEHFFVLGERGAGDGFATRSEAGSTQSTSTSNLRQGPHAVRFTVRGMPGLRGKIHIRANGGGLGQFLVKLSADVGDDSSIDLRTEVDADGGTATAQWSIQLDRSGKFDVRLISDMKVTPTSGLTFLKAGFNVVFTPGRFCDIAPYGAVCGPQIGGRDSVSSATRDLTLRVTNAPPHTPGVLLFGTQRWSVRLPGTRCFLLTDPVVLTGFATNQWGVSDWHARIPVSLRFAFNAQGVLLTRPGLLSTDAVAVHCR